MFTIPFLAKQLRVQNGLCSLKSMFAGFDVQASSFWKIRGDHSTVKSQNNMKIAQSVSPRKIKK